jgi:hypothetical protein
MGNASSTYRLEIVEWLVVPGILGRNILKISSSAPTKKLEEVRAVAIAASKTCHEVRVYENNTLIEVYRKGLKS